jgi:hypothetical protein
MISIRERRALLLGFAIGTLAAQPAAADEGGVSFWLPGQYGSLASVPGTPGWSLGSVYYHAATHAGGERLFPRGGRITAGLDVTADLLILAPSYVFKDPVLGGQASFGLTALVGHVKVGVEATVTGPGGGAVTGEESDSLSGLGDLYPVASLKWTRDVHNFMAYTMAGVPVGAYDAEQLANIGTNHWSLDAGGGYTYLDSKEGREFSATLGFTYSFENPDTDYQNGVSAHLDWALSQFFSETFHAGLVGYFYNQVSGDSGAGATLGDFESRVIGVGPEAGWLFNVGDATWYFNLKGYYEFDAKNRPEGWNAWLTLSLPLTPASS